MVWGPRQTPSSTRPSLNPRRCLTSVTYNARVGVKGLSGLKAPLLQRERFVFRMAHRSQTYCILILKLYPLKAQFKHPRYTCNVHVDSGSRQPQRCLMADEQQLFLINNTDKDRKSLMIQKDGGFIAHSATVGCRPKNMFVGRYLPGILIYIYIYTHIINIIQVNLL